MATPPPNPIRSRRRRCGAVLLVAATLAIAACSSDSSSSESTSTSGGSSGSSAAGSQADGVAEAKQIVAAAQDAPQFVAPPAFDVSSATGKTVWWLQSGGGDILKTWYDSANEALTSQGVIVKGYDIGDGTPDKIISGLELAISSKADAIVIGTGVPATQFSAQIAAADAAGIPVLSAVNSVPGVHPDIPGLYADNTFDYERAAQWEAAWIVADTEGDANVLTVAFEGVAATQHMVPAFEAELARLCPECENKTVTLAASASNIVDGFANLVRTGILSDSGVNYVNPLYDQFVLFAQPAISEAGKADSIGLTGFNGVAPLLQTLKAGGTSFQSDIGQPNQWLGWAIADNTLRALTGNQPVSDLKIGNRLFTHESLQDIDVSTEDDLEWYGLDLAAEYAKVWQ